MQNNESGICSAAAGVEATATQSWRQLWWITGGSGGIGGSLGDGAGRTVAMMGQTTIN